MTSRFMLIFAAVSGFIFVALGAFGAHALKATLLASGHQDTYELAVRYQFYHALALIGFGLLMDKFPGKGMQIGSALLVTGVVLFSGSLYLLALTPIRFVVFVTPVGGLCLLAGWGMAIYVIARKKP